MSRDPYLSADAETLRNNYGIRDPEQLEQVERVVSRLAVRQPMNPAPEMTPEGLQQIHRHIFGRVYPWAGEFRAINIEKVVTAGKTVEFERGPLVKPAIQRFFGELRDDNYLRGLDAKTFAYRAAVYMEDLNFIHPFREGNGRTARLFAEHLARQAGHALDQGKIDARGWMDGSVQSYRQPIDGAHDIMTRTIEQALDSARQQGRDHKAGGERQDPAKDDAIARAIEKVKDREARADEHDRDSGGRER